MTGISIDIQLMHYFTLLTLLCSMLSELCLMYPPEYIAVSCLLYALRAANVPISTEYLDNQLLRIFDEVDALTGKKLLCKHDEAHSKCINRYNKSYCTFMDITETHRKRPK